MHPPFQLIWVHQTSPANINAPPIPTNIATPTNVNSPPIVTNMGTLPSPTNVNLPPIQTNVGTPTLPTNTIPLLSNLPILPNTPIPPLGPAPVQLPPLVHPPPPAGIQLQSVINTNASIPNTIFESTVPIQSQFETLNLNSPSGTVPSDIPYPQAFPPTAVSNELGTSQELIDGQLVVSSNN